MGCVIIFQYEHCIQDVEIQQYRFYDSIASDYKTLNEKL